MALDHIKTIKLSWKLISNGILITFVKKDQISEMVSYMASQNFDYIENLVVCQICPKKISKKLKEVGELGKRVTLRSFFKFKGQNKLRQEDENFPEIKKEEVDLFFHKEDSRYYKTSKKTLLMFRRVIIIFIRKQKLGFWS